MTLQGNGNSMLTGDVYAKSALSSQRQLLPHRRSGAIVVNDIYSTAKLLPQHQQRRCRDLRAPPDGLHLDQ